MASFDKADMAGFGEKGGASITNKSTVKKDEGSGGSLTGRRLFLLYCVVCHAFSIYRAYEIYKTFDNWDGLNRKEKVTLSWGVISAFAMVFFTAAYTTLECKRRETREYVKA